MYSVVEAEIAYFIDHPAAGCKHGVEVTEQPAQINPCRRGCGRPEPAPCDLGHVRVTEGSGRHTAPLRGVERGPGQAVGIARFDQIGCESCDQTRSLATTKRGNDSRHCREC